MKLVVSVTLVEKKPTCLKTGLENVRRNGHGPVADSSHSSSKQHAGNTEFVMAAGKRKNDLRSEDRALFSQFTLNIIS